MSTQPTIMVFSRFNFNQDGVEGVQPQPPITKEQEQSLPTVTADEVSNLEENFFRVIGTPMAICAMKGGRILSVNSAMESQLGK